MLIHFCFPDFQCSNLAVFKVGKVDTISSGNLPVSNVLNKRKKALSMQIMMQALPAVSYMASNLGMLSSQIVIKLYV